MIELDGITKTFRVSKRNSGMKEAVRAFFQAGIHYRKRTLRRQLQD